MNFLRVLIPSLPFFILLWVEYSSKTISMYDTDQENPDEENVIRVAIVEQDNKAYWIIDNVLYEANLVDGVIDRDDAKPVDAFGMNYKEVNKMLKILDNIQDWKN